jgi:amino acid adenylation domain-containing protein
MDQRAGQICEVVDDVNEPEQASTQAPLSEAGYPAEGTSLQAVVADLWKEILCVDRVAGEDNFFALGGHSLRAIAMLERLQEIGLEADARDLFDGPTLGEFCKTLRRLRVPQCVVAPSAVPAGCERITPQLLLLADLTQEQIDSIVCGVPGGAANVQDIYPLVPLQEGMLFHHLLDAQRDPYLLSFLFAFQSRAHLDAFTAALQCVIARHDILRTAICWEGLPRPMQVVQRRVSLPVETVQFELLQEPEAADRVRAWMSRAQRPLDLRRAPLLRLRVLADARGAKSYAVLDLHHMVGDATSLDVVVAEINAHLEGRAQELPEAIAYRNHVVGALARAQAHDAEKFFRERLADVDEPTAPFELLDVLGDSADINEAEHTIGPALSLRLLSRSRRLGVSPATLVHAAWALVVARTSGREDVVFGTVLSGRQRAALSARQTLGMFINTLPLRLRLGPSITVLELIRQTHRELIELLNYEQASLAVVQRCSGISGATPLFGALLNYRHTVLNPEVESEGTLRVRPLARQEWTNYPISLSVDDLGDDFLLKAQTHRSVEPQRILHYMLIALERIETALGEAPDQPVVELDVLPVGEREQVLVRWNDTAVDYPQGRCVHELFEERVRAHPDAIALLQGNEQLSYAELNRRANQLAHHLHSYGVGPEQPVAVCMERGVDLVVGLLGVLKTGGAYVPLDPAHPRERLAYMLETSRARVMLTQAALQASCSALAEVNESIALIVVDHEPTRQLIAQRRSDDIHPTTLGLTSDNLAYVIYTSGSTGVPKAVGNSIAGLVNRLTWFVRSVSIETPVTALKTNLGFVDSVTEILQTLLAGGRLVVFDRATVLDIAEFARQLQQARVSMLVLVPSLLTNLLAIEAPVLDSIEVMVCSGERLSPQHIRQVRSRYPRVRLFNLYGSSEVNGEAAATDCAGLGVATHEQRSIIGRPIANTRIYILDSHSRPAPIGVVGEICVGGVSLARGYLHRPDLTRERFIANPYVSGERLYRTGDLARFLPDGNIEFLGRNDFQVKIRGFRIELGEIEWQLRASEAVSEAVVVVREDQPADKRLVAYYTLRAGAQVSAQTLKEHVSRTLASYMVPAAYVQLSSLPVTANGKLDRKALPAPDGHSYAGREYEAPISAAEQSLARIWGEVLKLGRVGRQANFFELGGHSLLAMRVLERMRREGLQADVRTLFLNPVLSELAKRVGSEAVLAPAPANLIGEHCERITPQLLGLVELTQEQIDRIVASVPGGVRNVQDIYGLTPLQEGILFHHRVAQRGDPYLLSSVLSFKDRATLQGYVSALNAVIARHDILRTAVLWEGLSEPVQVVWRQAPLCVEEVALAGQCESVVLQLQEHIDLRGLRMDVRHAPLMRLYVAQDRADERWVGIHLYHHLAVDQTTAEALSKEVQAHMSGEGAGLPAALPFRQFVWHVRQALQGEAHAEFFRGLLQEVEEPTAAFGMLESEDGSRVEELRCAVDGALSARLREGARALGVSAASLFHVAWGQVLARASGREEPVFGTVVFGRMYASVGVDRVMGPFINTLPLRIDMREASVAGCVRATHELLGQLLLHEHASLAEVQKYSQVPAPLPLFSALLNYRHTGGIERLRDVEQLGASGGRTSYPLTLSVDDAAERFALSVQVAGSVGAQRVCTMMLRALEQLVEALECNPTRSIRELDVLSVAEREQLLVGWNQTTAPYAQHCCIHELFEAQVLRTPAAVAVVYEQQQISYAQLNRRANQLAHHLHSMGVGPGRRVAICMDRNCDLIVGMLAVLKCGGTYVPLDPTYPAERIAYMLGNSAPVVALSGGAACAVLNAAFELWQCALPIVDVNAHAATWTRQPDANLDREAIGLTSQHLAYIIYTSGSTGKPKGIEVSHAPVINLIAWVNRTFEVGAGDSLLFVTSICFDLSVYDIFGILAAGATIRLADEQLINDPQRLAHTLCHERITFWDSAPAALQLLVPHLQCVAALALRLVFNSGDWIPLSLPPAMTKFFPSVRFISLGGATEATVWSNWYEVREVAPQWKSIPYGRPIQNARYYVLDGSLRPLPIGVEGDLYIGGACLANGYTDASLSRQRFIPSPFVAGERLYKTGDRARFYADGNLEFLGRRDFQVKIRGFRIELGEIEARLLEYPAVLEAAVVVREDSPGDQRLVAYYTAASEIAVEDLKTWLAQTLASYMVPVAYVPLTSLPLNPNGKLDRRALPAPDAQAYLARHFELPVGVVENALAEIWRDVLGLERVGRHDNFFELGGHSLLATRLLERMRLAGFVIDVRSVFLAATLQELARLATEQIAPLTVPSNLIAADCARITPELVPLAKLSQTELDHIVASVPGGVANVQDLYALSPLQEGFLFHHRMAEKAADPYLVWILLSFSSRDRLEAYAKAMDAVIARHDILRSAVLWENLSSPVQVVWRRAALPVVELLLDSSRGDVVQQLRDSLHLPGCHMDVTRAPMLRLCIAHDVANSRWVAMFLCHHLVMDHATLAMLEVEVQAHLSGQVDELPVPQPFRRFIAQLEHASARREHRGFFRQMLQEVAEPTTPFGLVDIDGSAEIAAAKRSLDSLLAARLRSCARTLGVSAASIFHAAWGRVLASAAGQDDPVFGTVVFGRMQGGAGMDRIMGPFINTLPLKLRLSDMSVEGCVRETHRTLAQLLSYEHASLAEVQQLSGIPKGATLFSALLNYRHGVSAAELLELSLDAAVGQPIAELLDVQERSNYPIALSVDDWGQDFALNVQVAASVGAERVCAMMSRVLEQIVAALETQPTQRIMDLDVLPVQEREQLLVTWNDTAAAHAQERCIHELFEAQVRRTPDAIALAYENQTISYAELNRRANRIAHRLHALGVRPDQCVALSLERSVEMIAAMLGILKAGAAYVPLDPAYPAERLRFMLGHSGAVGLVTQESLVASLFAQAVGTIAVPFIVLDATDPRTSLGEQSVENLDPTALGLTSRHLAYVIYTSGSTGLPKGVMVEHASVVNFLMSMQGEPGLAASDRLLAVTTMSFDIAGLEVYLPLISGAQVVLAGREVGSDPSRLQGMIDAFDITALQATPVTWRLLLNSGWNGRSTLKALCGGEALSTDLAAELIGRVESLWNMYGPTETTIWSSARRVVRSAEAAVEPIGRPIRNTRIYVLDADRRPVPIGVSGEIYIGGAGVARGYLNQREVSAERFIESPFVTGDRLYRTGDLGRFLSDGTIEFLGRNDFQVKIRGFRIELGEIELRLLQQPGVQEAVVIAREDQPGDQRLIAYVVVDEAELGAEEMRVRLKAVLPEYMLPSAVVKLQELPLTANGKLDRRALPAPDDEAYARSTYEAPQGAAEQALARIWNEVLKVERIGRHDNFFELGGHSLQAMRVLERMRREGLAVDARTLFLTPTLSELAQLAGQASALSEAPPNLITPECERITPELLPLVQLSQEEIDRIVASVPGGERNVQDIYGLAPLQEGILFHHVMAQQSDPYLLWMLFGFKDREALDAYVAALNTVIARHDILRTAVLWEGLSKPVQVVWRTAELNVEIVPLDSGGGDVVEQLQRQIRGGRWRVDITRAPLMQLFVAYDSAHDRWVALQLFHHLALDQPTSEIMHSEVMMCLAGRLPPLSSALPFRRFVAHVRHALQRDDHQEFFQKMLGDVREPTAPFGLTEVYGDGTQSVEVRLQLDSELSNRLRIRGQLLGVSVASLFHLAWAMLIARVSGRDDPVFGTVMNGRMHAAEGIERMLGPFINTLPVRVDLRNVGVEQCAREVHALLAQLLLHEQAPLAEVQQHSQLPAGTPLFTALLNCRPYIRGPQRQSADGDSEAAIAIDNLGSEARTNYPLTLSVDDLGGDFALSVQAVPEVGAERVCAMMRVTLERLMTALERAPQQPAHEVDVLTDQERQHLLVEWSGTVTPYPHDQCIHALFEAQVALNPAATALVHAGERLSYAELNRQSNRLAHYLRSIGVGADQPVAICVERGFEEIVGMLGILKAGGAYVPLDPSYPAERLAFMVRDSAAKVLLTRGALLDVLSASMADNPGVLAIVLDREEERAKLAQQPEANLNPDLLGLTSRHLAYIIYTSGSTGAPKGVMIEHANLTRLLFATKEYFHFDANDVWTLFHSLAFDFSAWEIWGALAYGGRLVIVPQLISRSPDEFFALLCREGVTILNQTPSAFRQLVAAQAHSGLSHRLRAVIFGGEVLELHSLKPWYQRESNRDTRLINMYGITEITVHATYCPLDPIAQHSGSPIGRRLPDSRLYILDADRRPVPIGVSGEIYIGGAGVARGYLNRPELNAERFIASPFVAGDRLYRSGDLGRFLSDGTIEFLGRNDFQVKLRGFRIELGEIELRLLQQPGVREAVVIAREDQPGDQRLIAYVVASEAEQLSVEEIRARLKAVLPEYMVPSALVLLRQLPLTVNGKLDRRALPAPDNEAYARSRYEAPQGEVENMIAAIWSEVLSMEQVGRHDNFFELGGHSLLAMRVLARMRGQGLQMDARALFLAPNLMCLAAEVEELGEVVL